MIKNVNIGEIDGKQLPQMVFMQISSCFTEEKTVFIDGKIYIGAGLNSHKTMSFTVGNTLFLWLLAGGKEKNGRKQKTENRNRFWERKERENSSDFGEGDAP